MTASLSRRFYKTIIHLYPKPFRHEFSAEMLSMFDECRADQSSSHLLVDVLCWASQTSIPVSFSSANSSQRIWKAALFNHPGAKLTIDPRAHHNAHYWGARFTAAIQFLFTLEANYLVSIPDAHSSVRIAFLPNQRTP